MITRRRLVLTFFLAAALWTLAGCNLRREADVQAEQPALTIRFEAPQNMTQIRAGDEIQVLLVAEDRGGPGVARVDLLVDGLPHQQGMPETAAAVPIFSVQMRWQARNPGLHALTAIAYREDGTASAPATIAVEVTS